MLDQRWVSLLHICGLVPYLIPNCLELLPSILSLPLKGIILTNGNTLNTDAPERDEVELILLEHALQRSIPLLGVCRGMQLILRYFGNSLEKVNEHVTPYHSVYFPCEKKVMKVNSFHEYGSFTALHPLQVIGKAQDGVVEAVRHVTLPVRGIMWHPERNIPVHPYDLHLIKELFGQEV